MKRGKMNIKEIITNLRALYATLTHYDNIGLKRIAEYEVMAGEINKNNIDTLGYKIVDGYDMMAKAKSVKDSGYSASSENLNRALDKYIDHVGCELWEAFEVARG